MRTLLKNKQPMKYALQGKRIPVYETDENGNIIYIEVDGERHPVESGSYETGYEQPVEFEANINNKLDEVLMKEFGIDVSTNYAQIVTDKGYLPIKAGDIIWKRSEVGYKDEKKGVVDGKTADYIVKGVADEGLTMDLFLLQKNVK